ncbi:MAG TPA: heavy metal-binding domain-containing protein, partial [Verrucomicrobiae bacterium]
MNKNKKPYLAKAALCITLWAAVTLTIVSCKKNAAESKPADVDYYTCTMHPSVKSQDPKAKCPICGMDLVPVKKKSEVSAQPTTTPQPSDIDYYTCTMHPSVRSKVPGKCPICGMDLVPVKKKSVPTGQTSMEAPTNQEAEQPSEFTVPVERQQQIGVTYGNVEIRP